MKRWKLKEKAEMHGEKGRQLPAIIRQLLFQRGIDSDEKINNFFNADYEKDLHDPFLIDGMEKAVERVRMAKKKNELVVVFGDYDADGVTSTGIMKEALDDMGINSTIYIPDKKTEGYGMNLGVMEKFRELGVKLIITADCGTTNTDEVEKANEYGIDVIITDHHHVPEKLPRALAIINPKMDKSGYPEKTLAGVGVAFKLVQALYENIMPEKKEQAKWMLDLVAVGTVADCVPLLGENRALTKYGLIVLSKTRRTGLREIFNVARLVIDENNIPSAYNISFQIAPRINAAGRMDHANIAYNLIMEKDTARAREMALELESNNQQRQKVTERVVAEIKVLAENSFRDKKFIFAVGEHFPIGIVGLAAGRIADAFNKPTAVLQKEAETSQGSFRSVPGVSIISAIEKCSELLIKFGGHDQAAGIKIMNSNLEKFYQKINSIIEYELKDKELLPEIEIDMEISADDINFSLVESLKKMEPFGEGNQMPVFLARDLVVNEIKVVGNGEKHLKLFLRSGSSVPKIYEAIGFNFAKEFPQIKIGDKIDAVFNLEEDRWNGHRKIQLKLIDMKEKK